MSERIEELISNSIQFGRYLKQPTRKILFDYILRKFNKSKDFKKIDNIQELNPYINFVDQVVSNPDVVSLAENNDSIFLDIIERMIKAFEQLDKEINISGDFTDEETEFIQTNNLSREKFFDNFEAIKERIKGFNPDVVFNFPFFQNEHEKLKTSKIKEIPKKKDAFKSEILERWNTQISKKKNLAFIKRLDEMRKDICDKLYDEIEKLKKMMKILQPFTDECGRLWDLSKGLWKNLDFNILEYYAQLIEREPEIQKLAEMLGRMHQAEDELEEELISETIIKPRKIVEHAQKSELVGIHESNDINYLLPIELTNLNDPTTELIFYQRFAEKKLLTYQFIGHSWGKDEEVRKTSRMVPKKSKKGPIIICVDTSGSMQGEPEYVAKTLSFAILRIALLEQRECYLISFSTSIETLELTDFNKSLPKLIEFLTFSFHGGTDAEPALEEAIRKIQSDKYEKADVLMISDFIMPAVEPTVDKNILSCKKTGTKFHSLVISSVGNKNALKVFDNNWIYTSGTLKAFKPVLKDIRML